MNRREAVAGIAGTVLGLGAASSPAYADLAIGGMRARRVSLDRADLVNRLAASRQASTFDVTNETSPKAFRTLVEYGMTALSHNNGQPWFLSCVADTDLLKKIDEVAGIDYTKRPSFGRAPYAVIISATDKDDDYQHVAIGGLLERLILFGELLGFSSRTVKAGLDKANADPEIRKALSVPEGYVPYVALLLGHNPVPLSDGDTGATSRKVNLEEKCAFIGC